MAVDVTLDLSSWYSDYYSNNGDFMILPFDDKGNVLSDAIPINYITDTKGSAVSMPFLVNSSTYDNYTFTYAAPADTAAFQIYASNVLVDESSPIYVIDIGF